MCLILTVTAFILAAIAWVLLTDTKKSFFGKLALMYGGASIMWAVDGVYRILYGEPFLELTRMDALLGITVVVCGILGLLFFTLFGECKKRTLSRQ